MRRSSGVTLSVPFLARLAREVPQVRYFKVEVPGAAAKLRALIEQGGAAIVGPFDGEESITLMADLEAGATGTMPSALLPDLIKPVVEQFRGGRRAEAAAAYARILPLINYENRQCGLRATKTAMAEGGVIKSDAVRHPLAAAGRGDARRTARARARPESTCIALGERPLIIENQEDVTKAVLAEMHRTPDPRTKEILECARAAPARASSARCG